MHYFSHHIFPKFVVHSLDRSVRIRLSLIIQFLKRALNKGFCHFRAGCPVPPAQFSIHLNQTRRSLYPYTMRASGRKGTHCILNKVTRSRVPIIHPAVKYNHKAPPTPRSVEVSPARAPFRTQPVIKQGAHGAPCS